VSGNSELTYRKAGCIIVCIKKRKGKKISEGMI